MNFYSITNILFFGPPEAAAPQTSANTATASSGGFWGLLFPFILIFGMMYFLIILPQRRQEKKHRDMLSQLKKDDKILTQAGIVGKVVNINNDYVRIRTADKTELDITKSSIVAILSKSNKESKEEK
ncbi:preprotein translocase subunit YajC [Marinitoga sp. 38H-ov]|uniref:preprotein translocase subunit YajC n=1 Tax=Marinitoga sp. 38H-ov TaxID=1755814 RepID=UPI0013EC0A1F|nr:preprotein translocase subunit YajC [Marinitoga sp. 38H-ov]KAF2956532.1 preprotein translocase subunit YajC [Marinitoga sp. 38H-ov]